MKTISIKQPWANLICSGVKDIENRTWPTKFRGRVLVQSSAKKWNEDLLGLMTFEEIDRISEFGIREFLAGARITGAIIGSVEIVDCVINHESIWAEKSTEIKDKEGRVVHEFKIYNWVLANPVLFAKPILNVKGKLSFWDYPITEEEYLNMLKIGQPIPESVRKRVEENNRYWQNGGHNGPTGHGPDMCLSDADCGL